MRAGLKIRDKVIGQSIQGVKSQRELPAVKELQRYKAKEDIIKAVEEGTGKVISGIIIEDTIKWY